MKHQFWSTLMLSAACVLWQSVLAQSTYQVTQIVDDLATPSNIIVNDLNNRGEAVAVLIRPGVEVVRAVLWRDGVITDIGDLNDGNSPFTGPNGINDRGDIVGSSEVDGVRLPFIYSNGQIKQLELFPSPGEVVALDINNFRQILGRASLSVPNSDNTEVVDFVQRGSRRIHLDPLPGFESSTTNQINELGIVVGQSVSGSNARAVIWIGSRAFNLGVLPGGSDSTGTAINDLGDVIGTSLVGDERLSFFWRRGKMTELMGISSEFGADALALAINNRRQIVGRQISGPLLFPLLWERDGKVYNLNDLISAADPLKPFINLLEAYLINDRGQIVANGRDSRSRDLLGAYLLTPVPR